MEHSDGSDPAAPPTPPLWKTVSGVVMCGFLLVAGFYLLTEPPQPPLQRQRPERLRLMAPAATWLTGLRRYLCVIVVGNLAWELAQLPLYTLWKTGSAEEIVFAVLHCTVGDVLIAGAALLGSLIVVGAADWRGKGFVPVAAATLVAGIGVTATIEHFSTTRGIWTYSDLMPLLPGTGLGLAPLAQWIVIPFLAFVVARPQHVPEALTFPPWESPRPVSRRTIWCVPTGERNE